MGLTKRDLEDIAAIVDAKTKSLMNEDYMQSLAAMIGKTVAAKYEKIIDCLTTEVENLKEANDQLKTDIDDLNQLSRNNNLRFFGIQETTVGGKDSQPKNPRLSRHFPKHLAEETTDDELIFKVPPVNRKQRRRARLVKYEVAPNANPIMTSAGPITEEKVSLGLLNNEEARIWGSEIQTDQDKAHKKTEKSGNITFEEYKEMEKIQRFCNHTNKIKEIELDLFELPDNYSLGHCVVADLQMSKVTKYLSAEKPEYEDVWNSLKRLEAHVRTHKVKDLTMPRIGCGLDRLNWSKVRNMINLIFQDNEAEITICKLPRRDDYKQMKRKEEKIENAEDKINIYWEKPERIQRVGVSKSKTRGKKSLGENHVENTTDAGPLNSRESTPTKEKPVTINEDPARESEATRKKRSGGKHPEKAQSALSQLNDANNENAAVTAQKKLERLKSELKTKIQEKVEENMSALRISHQSILAMEDVHMLQVEDANRAVLMDYWTRKITEPRQKELDFLQSTCNRRNPDRCTEEHRKEQFPPLTKQGMKDFVLPKKTSRIRSGQPPAEAAVPMSNQYQGLGEATEMESDTDNSYKPKTPSKNPKAKNAKPNQKDRTSHGMPAIVGERRETNMEVQATPLPFEPPPPPSLNQDDPPTTQVGGNGNGFIGLMNNISQFSKLVNITAISRTLKDLNNILLQTPSGECNYAALAYLIEQRASLSI
ncbi:hypothetical protein JTB14_029034 [Gonioctena quinquepunctata]|nr:hypothetical protein JTB14_029034 [Gonioctena quinquepunctata]